MNKTIQFSANLGFLWKTLPLAEAINQAAQAGFDAVECHMPYAYAAADIQQVLQNNQLQMVSLNTKIGDPAKGDLGVAALPGREEEAQHYIREAIDYAVQTNTHYISVVAGRTGKSAAAEKVYRDNLRYATALAHSHNKSILIEPLNTNVAADYHLTHIDEAIETIEAVAADNLKIMLDCFHTHTMEGDLLTSFDKALPYLGHVQISAFPDRGEPNQGDIDYQYLLPHLIDQGYQGVFGAEYNPRGDIDEGLSWLKEWQ